jgi:hypothetical protein
VTGDWQAIEPVASGACTDLGGWRSAASFLEEWILAGAV